MSNTNNNIQTQTYNTLHNAIMEACSKDRPPMLAPGNYVQWKSRIKQYIDTKPNHELIYYCLTNPPYELGWIDKEIPIFEESPITRTERFQETYKNVSQDIRDQLNAKAEAVQIILIGIDNDIYSTVMLVRMHVRCGKQLKESYHSRFYKMMNELIRNQCKVTKHQVNVQSQQAATRNRGKAIINSSQPIYDQEPSMVAEDDETSKDKEIDKLMALISLSFKKIYKPTNNNLRTPSNTSRANRDNSPRINRSAGYENQWIGNVVRARETKPKRVKDAAYHREKMLLCKKEEAGIQLNAEQADWRDDTDDDELEDQELEAHYMYMAQLQEVSLDVADSGPIFDDEPLQKVSNDAYYNVFAMESERLEQSEFVHDTYPIDQDAHNMIIDSLDMKAELARRNSIEYASQMEIECAKKEAQIKYYKTREDKELEKVIALENKFKVLDNIVYKTGQSVQTMNMLNNKCRTSFAKLEFLKKAQRANPRLYDIGCYNVNLALMLAPESDEVIRLVKESRSKLSDLIRPFDYNKLNNLYDLFVPQREKSSEQRYFSERSRLSHTSVNNGNSKESFNKQTTLLEKRMVESIPLDKKCQSSIEIFKVKTYLVEIVLFIVDSGCSKHMMGNLKLLINFVEKFLGTKNFRNDQITPILGYGDLVQGVVMIKRVYYVEGLNHNLFSVGQFCDADLEVAFRKSTCYIRDLKGNDLLTGSRGTELYSITLQDINCPYPICLMAKASSSQAWLWHRRLSHLNFDTINLLSKNDIMVGLPKLKFVKDHLCSSCELGKAKRKSFHTKITPSSKRRLQLLHMDLPGPMRVASINGKRYVLVIVDDYTRYTWTHFLRSKDETPKVLIDFLRLVQRELQAQVRIVRTDKGTKFLNQTLHAYFAAEGIHHQTSVARTHEQNDVVERRNRTLVEAARTMLSAANVPLFFWVEAIATACKTVL
nr:retrovirus-related Pol polyprotein from transposon TNT 1-94 [Tanacetum cinerariifolium]